MGKTTLLPSRQDRTRQIGLWMGLGLFFLILLFFDLDPSRPEVTRMTAVAVLMALWWLTEAIPLFATALLPMVLFPVLGIMKGSAAAPVYINSTIFLFIGGFMIALTMEKWNLHKRIALQIIRHIGGSPQRIIMGFMVAAAFLSMWISNTAAAIIMVPIGLAIILQLEDRFPREFTQPFSTALMLGIAYACSTGGVATLVGTPPNLAFSRIFAITFPEAPSITFGEWFLLGLPLSILMLGLIWLILTRLFFRLDPRLKVDRSIVDREYAALGAMSFEEKVVSVVFTLTAFLWVFRKPLILGSLTIPGWSELLPQAALIDDGTIALTMALSMYLIRTRSRDAPTPRIIGSNVIRRLPWNIVILFGGGFVLAKGFQTTGLSAIIGEQFSGLANVPPILVILLTCTTITFLTELTSNTATTQMILPILASVATAIHVNPLMLMIPATLAASQAFMMPVATPPNAIIFGSQRVQIREMARAGFLINIIGVLIITLVFSLLGPVIFHIESGVLPIWALPQ